MIRGIGDPLVAVYARFYLAKKGYELIPKEKPYLLELLKDSVFSWNQQCFFFF